MCVTPRNIMIRGQVIPVPCRKCWQCRQSKVWDWVGRSIAEDQCCVGSSVVTLTYGEDMAYGASSSEHASTLVYSDVQKWLKRIRAKGYPVRYLVAGELGPMKGRAHWHALLFWQRSVPQVEHNRERNWHDPFWEHGVTTWDTFHVKACTYVCKYILKDGLSDEKLGLVRLSKNPIIGGEYFKLLAQQHVDQGIPLPDQPRYRFPWVTLPDGTPRWFWMTRGVIDMLCRHYLACFYARHPGGHPPYSPLLEAWEDREAVDSTLVIPRPYVRVEAPNIPPPAGVMRFSQAHNQWWAPGENGERLWWSFDKEGRRCWDVSLRTQSEAASIREGFDALASSPHLARIVDRGVQPRPIARLPNNVVPLRPTQPTVTGPSWSRRSD